MSFSPQISIKTLSISFTKDQMAVLSKLRFLFGTVILWVTVTILVLILFSLSSKEVSVKLQRFRSNDVNFESVLNISSSMVSTISQQARPVDVLKDPTLISSSTVPDPTSHTPMSTVSQARPVMQIQDVLKDPNLKSPIWMISINKAFLDFLENLLCSISRLQLHPNIVIICEDEEVYRFLLQRIKDENIRIVVTNQEYSSALDNKRFTAEYMQLVQKRVSYVELFIQGGFDLFYIDADIVLVRDPFPYFKGNYDVFVQIEEPHSSNTFCSGFFYLKSSKSAISMIKKWRSLIAVDPRGNQIAFQKTLLSLKRKKMLNVFHLPIKQFSSGKVFFASKQHWKKRSPPQVSVHANWIVGHDKKKRKLQGAGLWFVNGTECIP